MQEEGEPPTAPAFFTPSHPLPKHGSATLTCAAVYAGNQIYGGIHF